MKLKDNEVLVTGAGGFIGSHLTRELVDRGCKVKAFVPYSIQNKWGLLESLSPHAMENIEIISGDLRDPDAVRHAAEDVDIIFHLGALVSIPYSYVHPRETIETNVLGTLNVLVAARDSATKKIVHTSTSEVYGTARHVPIDEEHPLQGQSPYSASKIGADKIAESFHLSYNLPVATIRPFNTYGPMQSARAVIPTIITQALVREEIHLGSTTPTRDFTYVKDTVDGFIKIAESKKSIGEVINVGSGQEISIGDLARKISSLAGKDIKVTSNETRIRPQKSEVGRLCADNSKAERLTGWVPKVSLEEGLRETIKWISGNLQDFKVDIHNI